MANNKLTIPRVADGKLLDVFVGLAQQHSATGMHVSVFGIPQGFDPRKDEWKVVAATLREKNSTLIHGLSVNFPDLSISFNRGGDQHSGLFDEVTFSAHNNQPSIDAQTRLAIVGTVTDELKAIDTRRRIGGARSEAQADLEAMHNSILQRLEQAATDQIQRNSEFARELEEQQLEKRKALEAEFTAKQADLDAWHRDRKAEFDEAEARLKKRESELDDRQNTHARRALQERLKAGIAARQQQFGLTLGTRKLRWPIHAVCLVLISLFGGLLYWSSSQTLELLKAWQSTANDYGLRLEFFYLIGRSITLAAAFVGTAFFYLKWLNRWFEQHSEAEFLIKKMELDIDRASWVVETAFEWNHQVDEPMPETLMNGISRNLFDGTGRYADDVKNPADELASALFGSAAAKVRLNNAGQADIEIAPSKLAKTTIRK
jgi:hypothetical protein